MPLSQVKEMFADDLARYIMTLAVSRMENSGMAASQLDGFLRTVLVGHERPPSKMRVLSEDEVFEVTLSFRCGRIYTYPPAKTAEDILAVLEKNGLEPDIASTIRVLWEKKKKEVA